MEHNRTVAVLGATGYIGGRLVAALLERGWKVRAVGRNPEKLRCRPFASHPNVEPVQADALDQAALTEAMRGCHAAYYLVHSMHPGVKDFEERDKRAALIMRDAAKEAGLERILYLGGLGDMDKDLSEHLKSRMEVGEILNSGSVPLTWLRAAMIIGSGSASFEILRYLVDRLPIMITPAWVQSLCQPIAVTNVLEYLVGCLERPETAGRTLDIGGPDILSYRELFDVYAHVAGLRRRIIIPVPVLTPKLSSYWIQLVTPVPSSLARPLAEGLRNKVVCRENSIRELVPTRLLTAEEAIARALDRTVRHEAQTCWSDAGEQRVPEWIDCGDAPYAGGTVLESAHTLTLAATPSQVWAALVRLGGDEGWLYGNLLWKIRGLADKLIGGPGLRRGRRHPEELRVGDALDFWRVLASDKGRRLLLLAEMRLPGEALLEFKMDAHWGNAVDLSMTAKFLPRGLTGILYWYAMYPFHVVLFKNIIKNISDLAGTTLYEPARRVR